MKTEDDSEPESIPPGGITKIRGERVGPDRLVSPVHIDICGRYAVSRPVRRTSHISIISHMILNQINNILPHNYIGNYKISNFIENGCSAVKHHHCPECSSGNLKNGSVHLDMDGLYVYPDMVLYLHIIKPLGII